MEDPPLDRCCYTWPEDHEIGDQPNKQSCCYRMSLPDTDRCAWHAAPEETESKTVNALGSSPGKLLDGANLSGMEIGDQVSFNHKGLRGADFSHTHLQDADFTGAVLEKANFRDADLSGADLFNAKLSGTRLDRADFSDARLKLADLRAAMLADADLSDADLHKTDLAHAILENADLYDTDLQDANLTMANLEHAVLVRTNLFDADLTYSQPHGATFTDVQINHDTTFRSVEAWAADPVWWKKGPLAELFPPLPRCAYDPYNPSIAVESKVDIGSMTKAEQLSKAADTYQTFEKLARENARPSLQSSMFVLRQDMQRKRHRLSDEYFRWGFARISRAVFKYGESLSRIVTWAIVTIALYAGVYGQFDLIVNGDGTFIQDPIDTLYFSTLTFTNLGLGDFQPAPGSESGRLLVTTQAAVGAILIAIFVFVLGRRAAK